MGDSSFSSIGAHVEWGCLYLFMVTNEALLPAGHRMTGRNVHFSGKVTLVSLWTTVT